MKKYDIGVIGLGVMGENLALNMANHGFSVAGFDLDPQKKKSADEKWAGKDMTTVSSGAELVEVLETPRRILMMVPAGKPVDSVIDSLKGVLAKDGSKTCNARLVKLPDGRSVFAGSSGGDNPPPPKQPADNQAPEGLARTSSYLTIPAALKVVMDQAEGEDKGVLLSTAALGGFAGWRIRSVPRAQNARADALVNQALDAAA